MRNDQIINRKETTINQTSGNSFEEKKASFTNSGKDPVFKKLAAEGGEDFFHYINWLGLTKDHNLMILSSVHHYYYDLEDLKGVRTLVNLKRLNQISNPGAFLHTIYRVLPPKANLVGCFEDYRKQRGITVRLSQSARLLNSFINMLDSRIDRILSQKDVEQIMKEHGFRVLDFTEINGLVYFCSSNVKKSNV